MRMKITTAGLAIALWCVSANAAQFTVFGVDRTEGYNVMTEAAIAIATDYVKQAGLGDEIVVRWISSHSYRPNQIITHLRVPIVELKEVSVFDNKGKQLRQATLIKLKRKVIAAKRQAVERLHGQCVGKTKRTDITGFVTAAAEQFATVQEDIDKLLILATDLGDNRSYEADIDLRGARVLIYLLHTPDDPSQVEIMRNHWSALFQKWGASSIEFRWPSFEQLNWRNKQCTQ